MLCVSLISRVDVVVLLSANRLPLINANEGIFEDFLGVDLDKATITVICDTTTIVTLGNEVLDGLPWSLTLDEVGIGHLLIGVFAHVIGNRVLADLIVGVVKGV